MANNEDILYTVTQRHWASDLVQKVYLFRTRKAARAFVSAKEASPRHAQLRWQIKSAVWGPDNVG